MYLIRRSTCYLIFIGNAILLKPNKFKVWLANILPDLALGLLKLIIIQIDPAGGGRSMYTKTKSVTMCSFSSSTGSGDVSEWEISACINWSREETSSPLEEPVPSKSGGKRNSFESQGLLNLPTIPKASLGTSIGCQGWDYFRRWYF